MHRHHVLFGLLSGLAGGIATFAYARLFLEPQVSAAIDYEQGRAHAIAALGSGHEHDHEVFSRSIQENVGAGVGTIVFSVAMGAFFGVAFTLLWSYMRRQHAAPDPRWVAAAVAALLFIAIYATPLALYPANPPSIGDPDTIGARSGAFLTITVTAVAAVIAAVIFSLWLRPRAGGIASVALPAVGYLAVVAIARSLLPRFDEVPTPLTDDRGALKFPGFPADTLAEFRLHTIAAQLVLWTVVTSAFAALLTTQDRRSRRKSEPVLVPTH